MNLRKFLHPEIILNHDLELPLDYALVARRPLFPTPNPRFAIILCFSPGNGQYVTWKYDLDCHGCNEGHYYFNEKAEAAYDDFQMRNNEGLYRLTPKEIGILADLLKTADVKLEVLDEAKVIYKKLTGRDMD